MHTSLEFSKQLKENGFEGESEMYWCDTGDYRDKKFDSYKPIFVLYDEGIAKSRAYNTKNSEFPDEQYPAYDILNDICVKYAISFFGEDVKEFQDFPLEKELYPREPRLIKMQNYQGVTHCIFTMLQQNKPLSEVEDYIWTKWLDTKLAI